jgi:type I restriction enzyme, S subunit
MWAWMAALGVSRFSGIVSPAYAVYRPLAERALVDAYADAVLRVRPYVSNYIIRSTGIRASRLRLYPDQFFNVPIIVPPREEQQKIVEHFNESTAGLSSAIAQAEREIALLREYCTRLVADVVTGQLDVCGAAASLSDVKRDMTPSEPEVDSDADVVDTDAA